MVGDGLCGRIELTEWLAQQRMINDRQRQAAFMAQAQPGEDLGRPEGSDRRVEFDPDKMVVMSPSGKGLEYSTCRLQSLHKTCAASAMSLV